LQAFRHKFRAIPGRDVGEKTASEPLDVGGAFALAAPQTANDAIDKILFLTITTCRHASPPTVESAMEHTAAM
jgi:hypothetical protein